MFFAFCLFISSFNNNYKSHTMLAHRITTGLPFKLILILLVTCFFACNSNATRNNREEDKIEAEQVTTLLFQNLQTKNYAAADTLFSRDFFKVTPKEKLNEVFKVTQEKLGDLGDTHLTDWKTQVVTGENASADYAFFYGNTYKKAIGHITIRLHKDPDNKIRIVYYTIHSDAFAGQ